VRRHEQIRGEQRRSAMATARRSSGLMLGHHTRRGARRSKRIIFPLAGAAESCFLHRGGLELLLLVRKRELWREGGGSHLCDGDEGSECAALLDMGEQLVLCEDGVLRRWILTCGSKSGLDSAMARRGDHVLCLEVESSRFLSR
jgi:hypothetical protein